ncbi:MAG: calcineurin phosphoesterase, partial [Lysobacteraceae bacterium]
MRFRNGVLWLVLLAASGGVQASDEVRTLVGTVFEDGDGDGRQGRGERGIAGVALSNGRTLAITDARGRYRLPVSPGQTVFA